MGQNASRGRIVRAALRLYPRWWRERYGEELSDVLDQQPLTVRTLTDVIRAAVRERIASGLMWQLATATLLSVGPFLIVYGFLPFAMTQRFTRDPLLSLIITPGPLVDLWIVPLMIGISVALALRWASRTWASSWVATVSCGCLCTIGGHAAMMLEQLGDGSAWAFLLSVDWLRNVYLQAMYGGFTAIGIIAHRLIAVPRSSRPLSLTER